MFTNMDVNFSRKMFASCLNVLACMTALVAVSNAEKSKSEPFNVAPGGMVQHHRLEWDGVSCTFYYACQGGTNEEWLFKIRRNKEKTTYECSVERPEHSSYLFFQQFSIETHNLKVKEAHGESEMGKVLPENEYELDTTKNRVSHVDGTFNSKLTKFSLRGKRIKDEL